MTFSIKSVLIHECQYKPTQINTIQHASDKVGISFKSQYYLKVIKKLVLIIIKSYCYLTSGITSTSSIKKVSIILTS